MIILELCHGLQIFELLIHFHLRKISGPLQVPIPYIHHFNFDARLCMWTEEIENSVGLWDTSHAAITRRSTIRI
jgi:hypothetical protein